MKMHILGSCSGTEPYPGRHHVSFAIEMENGIYWFDAGECCSYTAHLMGLDLLKVRNIFISHCHMDHVGGLGNLLWTIRKLTKVNNKQTIQSTIDVYIPYLETYEGIMKVLENTEDHFICTHTHKPHRIKDGTIYEGKYDDIQVTAIHNHHLEHVQGTPWRSFAFKIKANNKVIIYSGDTQLEDLNYIISKECDMLLMETGHHKVEDVCDYLNECGKEIKHLCFIHHGVEVLASPLEAEKRAKEHWKGRVCITNDAMTLEI